MDDRIAIIGLSCRLPGAETIEEYWDIINEGKETLSHFSEEELFSNGLSEIVLDNKNYVRTRGVLKNIEYFDADLFQLAPADAKNLDPLHRLTLECAWEAWESACYVPSNEHRLINVYAGMSDSAYLYNNLLKNSQYMKSIDWFSTRVNTSDATLATRLSYFFNLKGASITVNTACSTALVAVAKACDDLRYGRCDVAQVSTVALHLPQISGYLYQQSGIVSPDGHCRALCESAQGTVFSNGAGAVILKRFDDAVNDRDTIHAIIRGYHINNDGNEKIGFAAPGLSGQRKCITSALKSADLTPTDIAYVETHGTGTYLGDSIEIQALNEIFHQGNKKSYCALGSVKNNIGHTDINAGMASLIKVILCLKKRRLPPLINGEIENELITNTGPFYLPFTGKSWEPRGEARRAGVSAFGVGGTNAHVILEEYIPQKNIASKTNRDFQILTLTANNENSLIGLKEKMIQYLSRSIDNTKTFFENVVYTLHKGRYRLPYSLTLIAENIEEASSILENNTITSNKVFIRKEQFRPKIVFLFPGQGLQYPKIIFSLYSKESFFKKILNHCFMILKKFLHYDFFHMFENADLDQLMFCFNKTEFLQPLLFSVEYSLAKLLMRWGVHPEAMIGHSLGEYVAACLAGVLTLEDTLKILVKRAELMSCTSQGAMLAVFSSFDKLKKEIPSLIDIASINTPEHFVVSGVVSEIDKFTTYLNDQGISHRRLQVLHPFHSKEMEPVLVKFKLFLKSIFFKPPKISYLSNVTGDWICESEAVSPEYWCQHLRQTVCFQSGIMCLLQSHFNLFIEVGPEAQLTSFVRSIKKQSSVECIATLSDKNSNVNDLFSFYRSIAKLSALDVPIQWDRYYESERRQRIPIPTYSFNKHYYWVEANVKTAAPVDLERLPYPHWYYTVSWKRICSFKNKLMYDLNKENAHWIVIASHKKLISEFKKICHSNKMNVYFLEVTTLHSKADAMNRFYKFVHSIVSTDNKPIKFIYFGSFAENPNNDLEVDTINVILKSSFFGLLWLSQVISQHWPTRKISIYVISNQVYSVAGDEIINPVKAILLGPCRVIPQEHANITMFSIDVDIIDAILLLNLIAFLPENKENIYALRKNKLWQQVFVSIPKVALNKNNIKSIIRKNGVYLLTGGARRNCVDIGGSNY